MLHLFDPHTDHKTAIFSLIITLKSLTHTSSLGLIFNRLGLSAGSIKGSFGFDLPRYAERT
jgi:hypothetical protein